MKAQLTFLLLFLLASFCPTIAQEKIPVIVSSDIGGYDPDDHQSLVHFLLYADRFEVLGLISSPPGKGRVNDIEEVLEAYEADYPNLLSGGLKYPEPESLRRVVSQGEISPQASEVPGLPSSGAKFIAKQVLAYGKPVYVLVWGSMTDLAQAIHHFPHIKPLLRVYSIGSWNTEQDPKSRDYLWKYHPDLWWIENNTTFRGMYMGGNQENPWGNISFVESFVKNCGAVGKLFYQQKSDIKMGDTPSVLYLLHGNPEDPEGESWGGSFKKDTSRPSYWTDRQDANLVENNRAGARTVNRFRQTYLEDWKTRMEILNK